MPRLRQPRPMAAIPGSYDMSRGAPANARMTPMGPMLGGVRPSDTGTQARLDRALQYKIPEGQRRSAIQQALADRRANFSSPRTEVVSNNSNQYVPSPAGGLNSSVIETPQQTAPVVEHPSKAPISAPKTGIPGIDFAVSLMATPEDRTSLRETLGARTDTLRDRGLLDPSNASEFKEAKSLERALSEKNVQRLSDDYNRSVEKKKQLAEDAIKRYETVLKGKMEPTPKEKSNYEAAVKFLSGENSAYGEKKSDSSSSPIAGYITPVIGLAGAATALSMATKNDMTIDTFMEKSKSAAKNYKKALEDLEIKGVQDLEAAYDLIKEEDKKFIDFGTSVQKGRVVFYGPKGGHVLGKSGNAWPKQTMSKRGRDLINKTFGKSAIEQALEPKVNIGTVSRTLFKGK